MCNSHNKKTGHNEPLHKELTMVTSNFGSNFKWKKRFYSFSLDDQLT